MSLTFEQILQTTIGAPVEDGVQYNLVATEYGVELVPDTTSVTGTAAGLYGYLLGTETVTSPTQYLDLTWDRAVSKFVVVLSGITNDGMPLSVSSANNSLTFAMQLKVGPSWLEAAGSYKTPATSWAGGVANAIVHLESDDSAQSQERVAKIPLYGTIAFANASGNGRRVILLSAGCESASMYYSSATKKFGKSNLVPNVGYAAHIRHSGRWMTAEPVLLPVYGVRIYFAVGRKHHNSSEDFPSTTTPSGSITGGKLSVYEVLS
jgi:hypothetical protein